MARIRTIKPEFWDSPSVAKASPWARLLFIALWNWADDYGRGTANLKELEGFAFPNDNTFTDMRGNTVHFRDVVAEVADCFGVVFYEVEGRPFFLIPTWEKHQRNERRAKASKFPDPPTQTQADQREAETPQRVAEIPCKCADAPRSSGPGTGEQGNRGTGEQGNSINVATSDEAAPADEERPEVEALCTHLANRIEANGSKRPTVTKAWRDECRRMIDLDKRSPADIRAAIDWSQSDDFWRANILSMPTLRKKFDQMRLQAARGRVGPKLTRSEEIYMAEKQRIARQEQPGRLEIPA